MPFVSTAQQGFFETHKKQLEDQGVNVSEWEQASKGQHNLPEHVNKGKPWHKRSDT